MPEDLSRSEPTYIDLIHDFLNKSVKKRTREILLHRWEGLKTLEEIGEEFNITRERVRQICSREEKRLKNMPIGTLLSVKLSKILSKKDVPLYLNRLEVFDPWFEGVHENLELSESIIKRCTHVSFFVWQIRSNKIVTKIKKEEWDLKKKKLISFLKTLQKNSLSKYEIKIYIEVLLKESNAKELCAEMFSEIEEKVVFIEGKDDQTSRFVMFLEHQNVSIFYYKIIFNSKKPLHYSEIFKRVQKLNPKKNIDERNIQNELVRNRDFLNLGQGLYGIEGHLEFDMVKRKEIVEICESLIEKTPQKQWNWKDFIKYIEENGIVPFGELNYYTLNAILLISKSRKIKTLGRGVWVSKNIDSNFSKRIMVAQAAARILEEEGNPLEKEELTKRVEKIRGGKIDQITANDTQNLLIEFKKGTVGLTSKHLVFSEEEVTKFLDILEKSLKKKRGIINYEEIEHYFKENDSLYENVEDPFLFLSLAKKDKKFSTHHNQYIYLSEWKDSSGKLPKEFTSQNQKVLVKNISKPKRKTLDTKIEEFIKDAKHPKSLKDIRESLGLSPSTAKVLFSKLRQDSTNPIVEIKNRIFGLRDRDVPLEEEEITKALDILEQVLRKLDRPIDSDSIQDHLEQGGLFLGNLQDHFLIFALAIRDDRFSPLIGGGTKRILKLSEWKKYRKFVKISKESTSQTSFSVRVETFLKDAKHPKSLEEITESLGLSTSTFRSNFAQLRQDSTSPIVEIKNRIFGLRDRDVPLEEEEITKALDILEQVLRKAENSIYSDQIQDYLEQEGLFLESLKDYFVIYSLCIRDKRFRYAGHKGDSKKLALAEWRRGKFGVNQTVINFLEISGEPKSPKEIMQTVKKKLKTLNDNLLYKEKYNPASPIIEVKNGMYGLRGRDVPLEEDEITKALDTLEQVLREIDAPINLLKIQDYLEKEGLFLENLEDYFVIYSLCLKDKRFKYAGGKGDRRNLALAEWKNFDLKESMDYRISELLNILKSSGKPQSFKEVFAQINISEYAFRSLISKLRYDKNSSVLYVKENMLGLKERDVSLTGFQIEQSLNILEEYLREKESINHEKIKNLLEEKGLFFQNLNDGYVIFSLALKDRRFQIMKGSWTSLKLS